MLSNSLIKSIAVRLSSKLLLITLFVVVVLKGGQIIESGTFKELTANPDSEFSKLNSANKKKESERKETMRKLKKKMSGEDNEIVAPEEKKEEEEEEQKDSDDEAEGAQLDKQQAEAKNGTSAKKGGLTGAEARSTGAVPSSVYFDYLNSGGGLVTFLTLIMFIFAQGVQQGTDWWLSVWAGEKYNLGISSSPPRPCLTLHV